MSSTETPPSAIAEPVGLSAEQAEFLLQCRMARFGQHTQQMLKHGL